MKTGMIAFFYSIRTAILPFIFIFNVDLLLLDIVNPLEALLIFCVSLIAILAFTSLTFRWMFVRLNIIEMALIAAACLLLFRPDLVMNRFYAPDIYVSPEKIVTGIESDRLSLTVFSRYKNSSRIVKIKAPDGVTKLDAKALGLTGQITGEGSYAVTLVQFKKPAQMAGLSFGDVILDVRKPNVVRPSPRWLFIPALLMLGFVFGWQRRRASQIPVGSPQAKSG